MQCCLWTTGLYLVSNSTSTQGRAVQLEVVFGMECGPQGTVILFSRSLWHPAPELPQLS